MYVVCVGVCINFLFLFQLNPVFFTNSRNLKGHLQGQQERGKRGKGTLPAFAARLLNQQERGEHGECSLVAFDPSNKRIRTENNFKIYKENFIFSFFSFC